MSMKIVSGLGSIDDYETLVEAGADEFFIGYVPFEWNKKYSNLVPLNRREVLYYNVQVGTIEDLKILKKMVDCYGVPIKITLNSLYYTQEQYPLIFQIIRECMEVGFDVFIVSDPALLYFIRKQNIPCKIHLSGETSEVNRPMMEYFDQYEITRYIFHRKNTIEDMKRCIQKRKYIATEYEAFLLNEYCHFTGAFCSSLHCDEMAHLCKLPYQLSPKKLGDKVDEIKFEYSEEDEYIPGSTGCGLCSLKELQQAGVTHLKIVGRGNHLEFMKNDISAVKRALELIPKFDSIGEYGEAVRRDVFGKKCSKNCYYR